MTSNASDSKMKESSSTYSVENEYLSCQVAFSCVCTKLNLLIAVSIIFSAVDTRKRHPVIQSTKITSCHLMIANDTEIR